jgi:hypothetical protein
MPIWKTPGVDDQPSVTVVRWRVLQVAVGECKGQRHIVAYCPENFEGRVSTNIVSFDAEKRTCITRTGRTYCLHGPPGFDADGEFVWQTWTRGSVNSIDISQEFVTAEMES